MRFLLLLFPSLLAFTSTLNTDKCTHVKVMIHTLVVKSAGLSSSDGSLTSQMKLVGDAVFVQQYSEGIRMTAPRGVACRFRWRHSEFTFSLRRDRSCSPPPFLPGS
ncbi:unnamed protein product [Ectocarpus sp. 8 AP-2014]